MLRSEIPKVFNCHRAHAKERDREPYTHNCSMICFTMAKTNKSKCARHLQAQLNLLLQFVHVHKCSQLTRWLEINFRLLLMPKLEIPDFPKSFSSSCKSKRTYTRFRDFTFLPDVYFIKILHFVLLIITTWAHKFCTFQMIKHVFIAPFQCAIRSPSRNLRTESERLEIYV